MNRRNVLQAATALAASSTIARAQQESRVPVVAMLRSAGDLMDTQIEVYRDALRKLGHVEGKTLSLEHRLVRAAPDSFEAAARQLVQSKVAVIFAVGTPAAIAARKATDKIPILFYVADPIGSGLIASLARPSGNLTGIASMAEETAAKRIELLRQLLPDAARIGVIANPDNPVTTRQLKLMQSAAETLRINLQLLEIRRGTDLERVLDGVSKPPIDALVTIADPILNANQKLLARHALNKKIPSIAPFRGYTEVGGLMSYGPDYRELLRRCAAYTDKLLKGIPPQQLPVEQPTKFELLVNERTARAIGIKIPETIALRADQVIR